MNPEGHYNNKSDIWSIGCILYELVTRRKPFPNDTQAYLYSLGIVSIQVSFDPQLEDRWKRVISDKIFATLAPLPAKRPSASQLANDFTRFYQYASKCLQPHNDGTSQDVESFEGIGSKNTIDDSGGKPGILCNTTVLNE